MILVKGQLSKKDTKSIWGTIQTLSDPFTDFYLTQNNLRIYIKENFNIFLNNLKRGDRLICNDDGIIMITGWADKSPRKYLKILAKNNKIVNNLLKVLLWNFSNINLYAKLKWKSPSVEILNKYGFKFLGGRGKEVLLVREKTEPKEFKVFKEKDDDSQDTEQITELNRG